MIYWGEIDQYLIVCKFCEHPRYNLRRLIGRMQRTIGVFHTRGCFIWHYQITWIYCTCQIIVYEVARGIYMHWWKDGTSFERGSIFGRYTWKELIYALIIVWFIRVKLTKIWYFTSFVSIQGTNLRILLRRMQRAICVFHTRWGFICHYQIAWRDCVCQEK